MLSAHCGATWLVGAKTLLHLKTMGWKPGKKLWPLRLSCGDFRERREHCAERTPTQASQTRCSTTETQSILAMDRKFNKEPWRSKSFILAQGITHKTMFVFSLFLVSQSQRSATSCFKATQLRKAEKQTERTSSVHAFSRQYSLATLFEFQRKLDYWLLFTA